MISLPPGPRIGAVRAGRPRHSAQWWAELIAQATVTAGRAPAAPRLSPMRSRCCARTGCGTGDGPVC